MVEREHTGTAPRLGSEIQTTLDLNRGGFVQLPKTGNLEAKIKPGLQPGYYRETGFNDNSHISVSMNSSVGSLLF